LFRPARLFNRDGGAMANGSRAALALRAVSITGLAARGWTCRVAIFSTSDRC